MGVAEGTRAGVVWRTPGSTSTELRFGEAVQLGPVRGIPVWLEPGGLRLLILVPVGFCPMVVKKGGARQAGAFLLGPWESFSLGEPSSEEADYAFEAPPSIEVVVERGDRCSFCRTALVQGGLVCLSPALDATLRERVLCPGCADAWASPSGEEAGGDGKLPRSRPLEA